MATKAKSPKTTAATVSAPVVTITVPAVANPFAALVAAPTAPAKAPLVHALAVGGATLVAANHVATFKGTKAATTGGTSYTLGATAHKYNPNAGHVNAVQWQAVQAALAANGGTANVGQIAAAFAAAGLSAGLAASFAAYRAKAGGLEIVKA